MKTKKTTKKRSGKKSRRAKRILDPLGQLAPIGTYCGLTAAQADAALQTKILALMQDCPEVVATGEVTEPTGEKFKFTIYSDVRKAIDPWLVKHRLTFIPYSDEKHPTVLTQAGGWHYLTTHYRLGDAETGYYIIVPGCGIGLNRWWAADSAGTLALKHALMEALHIRWDNRSAVERMLAGGTEIIGDIVKEVMRQLAEKQEGKQARPQEGDAVAELKNHDWKGQGTKALSSK